MKIPDICAIVFVESKKNRWNWNEIFDKCL